VNGLLTVALDSAAAGIEPAIPNMGSGRPGQGVS